MEAKTEAFRAGMCLHTSKAIDKLKDGKPGDMISREAMAAVIGRSCELSEKGYANVMSAIRHVERVHGVVWRWGRTEQAFVCLSAAQAVDDVQQTLKRSGKMARRALTTASTIKPEELDDEHRSRYRAACVQAELIRLSVTAETHKRLLNTAEVKTPDVKKLMAAIA